MEASGPVAARPVLGPFSEAGRIPSATTSKALNLWRAVWVTLQAAPPRWSLPMAETLAQILAAASMWGHEPETSKAVPDPEPQELR